MFVLHLLGSVRICRWDPFVPSHPAQGCCQGYLVTGDFRLVRGRRLRLTPQCRFPMCRVLCQNLMSLLGYWGFQCLLLGHSVGDFLFHAAFRRLGHMWE